MDISTTDLILNISPATIRVISAIAAGLSKQDVSQSMTDRFEVIDTFDSKVC